MMKHKKKRKRKVQSNMQGEKRKLEKNKSLVTKNINGEEVLTTRGILLYWWFWHDSRYLKDFEKIIDEYGEELVLNAVIISIMNSNMPIKVIIFAIKNNLVNLFINNLNFNIMNLPIHERNKYQETKKYLIESTITKYKLDKQEKQGDIEIVLNMYNDK